LPHSLAGKGSHAALCRDEDVHRGLHIPVADGGADVCRAVVHVNTHEGATWVHSYVTEDKTTSYCIYDAPSPEAIRKAAIANGLPVDRIAQVRVLDPYFYV
jgi:hypothetical protein